MGYILFIIALKFKERKKKNEESGKIIKKFRKE
jgi:hypothetical protein